jgi:murein DD-endopeptidase MepM/ murein hydrolase activator NlpD
MKVFNREKVKAMGYTDAQINAYLERVGNKPPEVRTESATAPTRTPTVAQDTNTNTSYPITQTFGQRSKYDVFSGGVNYGVDFATPRGTAISIPEGNWKVENAYSGASGRGYIGNKANSGYGNSVVLQNQDTGEKVRLSHLDKVAVQTGDEIQGGVIGLSGATGNVTGPHLDAEYYDSRGQKADILKTPYKDLFRSTIPNKPKRSGSQSLLGY